MYSKEEEDERAHVAQVLIEAQQALRENDSAKLQELSNQTIHTASISQHTDAIMIAVLMYTLGKLSMKKSDLKIKKWEEIVTKINSLIGISVSAFLEKNDSAFNQNLQRCLKAIESFSGNLKPYIKEVILKAEINKASKIYEHGISLAQTASLLGVTQWEMLEYIGQGPSAERPENRTMYEKDRAKMALEFFK